MRFHRSLDPLYLALVRTAARLGEQPPLRAGHLATPWLSAQIGGPKEGAELVRSGSHRPLALTAQDPGGLHQAAPVEMALNLSQAHYARGQMVQSTTQRGPALRSLRITIGHRAGTTPLGQFLETGSQGAAGRTAVQHW